MRILFILSVIFLFFVILLYPKSKEKRDLFPQIVLSVLSILEINTLWGYITLDFFNIGFELSYYASYNLSFALMILLYWIVVKKERAQEFLIDSKMWLTVILLFAVTVSVGIWRYGPRINLFAYCSADSANHLSLIEALKMGEKPDLDGRFFLHLNEALFFKCIETLVQSASYYRVFLFAEMFFWFLSGAMFYALIRKYMTTPYKMCIGIFFVFVYFLGYPLNNLLYGYEYLGASVTIAIHIVYLAEKVIIKNRNRFDVIISLIIACFAMYHCYSLLFVGVLIGLQIIFCINVFWKPNFIKIGLLVGEIAMILFLAMFKLGLLGGYWQKMISKLTTEAIMYRDLWFNLLWLIPCIIIGIKLCVKQRKRIVPIGMFFGVFGAMGLFFWYMWKGEISSYYFYKFYFLLWFLCVYLACIGLIYLNAKYSKIILIYMLIFIIFTTGLELLGKEKTNCFGIYATNLKILLEKDANMDMKRQELFYAAAQKVQETGGVVPYIGTWETYWGDYFYALTNQVQWNVRINQKWDIKYNYPVAEERINDILQICIYDRYDYVPYIMVERNSEAYWYGIGYYSLLEVEYENEYGFIYKR